MIYTENEVPHPHDLPAFGFWKRNPPPKPGRPNPPKPRRLKLLRVEAILERLGPRLLTADRWREKELDERLIPLPLPRPKPPAPTRAAWRR